jgi:hypothetical protein
MRLPVSSVQELSALLFPLPIWSVELQGSLVIRLEATAGSMSVGDIAIFEEHCDYFFEANLPVENIADGVTSTLIDQEFTPLSRRAVHLLQGAPTVGVLFATTRVLL